MPDQTAEPSPAASSGSSSALQIEAAEALIPLLQPARYKAAYGGRASCKSHFFAGLAVAESISRKCDIVCVREIQKSLLLSAKKTIDLKIAARGLGHRFKSMETEIRSDSGGLIIFQGMQNHTAEAIKSLEDFDICWVEEAQSLSARSLSILRPTLRKPGSQLWFSWNPNLPTDPVDAFFRGEEPPPDSIIVRVDYRDNPWLSDESRKDMEYDRRRDPEAFAHVWLGEYQRHSEARVFRNWTVEEFERVSGTVFRLGADWGYAIDPSVLVRCSIEGNRLYIDHEAYMIGCEIMQLPELFDRVPESRKWFITADSARPETISHMQRHGYPKINAALKGARSIEEGVAFLQSFDIIVHPRCTHVIDELTLYSYKQDPLTEKVLPVLDDKHNHCIDALRYACEGVRKARQTKMNPLNYDNRGII